MKIEFVCEYCKNKFLVQPSRVAHAKGEIRFCSRKCYENFRATRLVKICEVCGKRYEVIKCRENSRFCSEKCRRVGFTSLKRTEDWNNNISKSLEGKERSKEHCENISKAKTGCHYIRDENYSKAISTALRGNPKVIASAKRGVKSNFWKGGVTPFRKQIRELLEYKNWSRLVFERDNYTCQACKKRGGNLEVHHIKSFLKILEDNNITTIEEAKSCLELWDIDNGKTLCKKCHKKEHSKERKNGG